MKRFDAIKTARKYGLVSNPELCKWLDFSYTLEQYLCDAHFYVDISEFNKTGAVTADTTRPIPADEKGRLWNRVIATRAEITARHAKDCGDPRPLHVIRDSM